MIMAVALPFLQLHGKCFDRINRIYWMGASFARVEGVSNPNSMPQTPKRMLGITHSQRPQAAYPVNPVNPV